MKVVTVVQARMGSTRFPGKVLTPLRGKPMLAHVLERAIASRCSAAVVLATSTDSIDDPVAALGRSLEVGVVRGPAEDVLTRFVMAQRESGADVVVRVTADCPLLDPRLIDRVVGRLLRSGADYVSNVDPPTYPDGYDVEAMTSDCLARLDAAARLPREREHVTVMVGQRPGEYTRDRVVSRRDYSDIRLTVDVPPDLARIDRLLEAIGQPRPGLGAVLAQISADPSMRETSALPGRNEAYVAQRKREQGG